MSQRLAAMTGLAVAAAIAAWWLGVTRLAVDRGADAGRGAAEALDALVLVRAMVLAIVSVRIGGLQGWRAGATAALMLIAPSWPVAGLTWSASDASPTRVVLAELELVVAGGALPLIGRALRHLLRRAELAAVAGTAVGVALAAWAWATPALWRVSVP